MDVRLAGDISKEETRRSQPFFFNLSTKITQSHQAPTNNPTLSRETAKCWIVNGIFLSVECPKDKRPLLGASAVNTAARQSGTGVMASLGSRQELCKLIPGSLSFH